MRWTRKSIVAEIKKLHAQGVELNYATAEADNLNLVRASAWHFGTWRRAVEAAGIDYESIGKYRHWSCERIVARIHELHAQGADLSWRAVSTDLDPPLAAAALRPNGFNSWREAIAAAGLDINTVARYQLWDEARVVRDIKALRRARAPLSSKAVQSTNQPLFCAARRRFGSWDQAIAAAGFSIEEVRLRRPTTGPNAAKKESAKKGSAKQRGRTKITRTTAAKIAGAPGKNGGAPAAKSQASAKPASKVAKASAVKVVATKRVVAKKTAQPPARRQRA